jgi:hypothetical protein
VNQLQSFRYGPTKSAAIDMYRALAGPAGLLSVTAGSAAAMISNTSAAMRPHQTRANEFAASHAGELLQQEDLHIRPFGGVTTRKISAPARTIVHRTECPRQFARRR